MAGQLLSAAEIRQEFGYSPSSLKRWEKQGMLSPARTPGGQRRYPRSQIEALASGNVQDKEHIGSASPSANPATPPDKDAFRDLGDTGLNRWGGAVYEERLRELRGRPGRILYREMRLNDPVIAAVLFALSQTLKQPEWRVMPASEEPPDLLAADYLESCIDDMSFSWQDTLAFIIEPMLEQGFSALEITYKRRLGDNPPNYLDPMGEDQEAEEPAPSKYNDGRIGWRKWSPRPAESLVDGNEWVFDKHGGIQGINQELDNGQPVFIPIEKLLHFRTTLHPANNPEGMPIHRPAYLPYWYTSNIQEIEGIGIERDLAGIPVVYLGDDRSDQYDNAKKLVNSIKVDEQAGVVIQGAKMGGGAPEGQGMLLELLASSGTRKHDTNAIIERYDRHKALIVLAQFIMLGSSNVGSWALSRHQGDMFTLAASAWLNMIADIINRHAVTRLFRFNVFPGITGLPKLVPAPLGLPNLTAIAEYINKLVDKGVLTPDIELERHVRQLADLPEKPEEEEMEEEPELTPDIDKIALQISRLRLSLEPQVDLGIITEDQLRQALSPTVNRLLQASGVNSGVTMPEMELAKDHGGELIDISCPFCTSLRVMTYKDHEGLAVCPECEQTFDIRFHYGETG